MKAKTKIFLTQASLIGLSMEPIRKILKTESSGAKRIISTIMK
jgi:hypothetical protein